MQLEWMVSLSRIEELSRKGNFLLARTQVQPLLSLPVPSAAEASRLGFILQSCGDVNQAMNFFFRAMTLEPKKAIHAFNYAVVCRNAGHIDEAEKFLNQSIALKPDDGEAYYIRSTLRKQSPENDHIDELCRLFSSSYQTPQNKIYYGFALAKEYEDLEDYDQSFAFLQLGAKLKRSSFHYDVDVDIAAMKKIARTFSDIPSRNKPPAQDARQPIFVVGLPRSGSTLIEQILSMHTQVVSMGELEVFSQEIQTMISRSHQRPLSKGLMIDEAANLNMSELGTRYLEAVFARKAVEQRFVDKMPLNFLNIGLIMQALPQASVICIQRDAMDNCYAIFKTLFEMGYPFSYNQSELGRYYRAYQKLMAHWQKKFPHRIHTVTYEQLVESTEEEVRAMLDFCGLPWEQNCLDFQRNSSAVYTASASQVRQPIYSSSVGRWRHYQKQLEELSVSIGY